MAVWAGAGGGAESGGGSVDRGFSRYEKSVTDSTR